MSLTSSDLHIAQTLPLFLVLQSLTFSTSLFNLKHLAPVQYLRWNLTALQLLLAVGGFEVMECESSGRNQHKPCLRRNRAKISAYIIIHFASNSQTKSIHSNYQSDWMVGKLDCDSAVFNLGQECQILFLEVHFPVPHFLQ